VSQIDNYLSIYPNGPDVLDINNSDIIKDMNKHNLDFAGWDIRKTLYQISRGNPDLISWFYSPIIYRFADNAQIIKDSTIDFFKPVSAYYHYLHMASKNYNQYIRNPESNLVNIKKYLYVLRPICACIWIELNNSIPPMKFEDVFTDSLVRTYLGQEILDEIWSLVILKKSGTEMSSQPRNVILNTFIERQIAKYEQKAKEVDFEVKTNSINLNKTFQQFAKGEL
jgi:predicted nucleotidyltransferase